MPSLRYNNTSVITSKVIPQTTQRSMTESSIYVERSFDVTEMVMMEEGNSGNTGKAHERKEPEVWTDASRESSQEVLVRDPPPGTAR
jgi:hypothetical protein